MLKDESLNRRTGGEIQLRLSLSYSLVRFTVFPALALSPIFAVHSQQVTAAVQLVSRRQMKYITDEERFRLAVCVRK